LDHTLAALAVNDKFRRGVRQALCPPTRTAWRRVIYEPDVNLRGLSHHISSPGNIYEVVIPKSFENESSKLRLSESVLPEIT